MTFGVRSSLGITSEDIRVLRPEGTVGLLNGSVHPRIGVHRQCLESQVHGFSHQVQCAGKNNAGDTLQQEVCRIVVSKVELFLARAVAKVFKTAD